jgi:predicted neuraminidase
MQTAILDLPSMTQDGVLFRPPDDKHRVDAFIPPMGR